MSREGVPFSGREARENIDDGHVYSPVLGRMESSIERFPHVVTGSNRCTVYGVLKTKIIGDGPCANPGHEVPYMARVNGDVVNTFFKVLIFCFTKK